jgi:hypothetical protein
VKALDLRLDHLVLGVPDLEQGAGDFAARTGIEPTFGGRHATGTANYLVGLGGEAYLEIIGILPEERDNGEEQPFQLETLTAPRLVTWCLRSHDIESDVAEARNCGVELGRVLSLSRQAADGSTLAWQMTRATPMPKAGMLPFLIDWGSTPHPTTRDLPSVQLSSIALSFPDADGLQADLDVLGPGHVRVTRGAPALRARLTTPAGELELR